MVRLTSNYAFRSGSGPGGRAHRGSCPRRHPHPPHVGSDGSGHGAGPGRRDHQANRQYPPGPARRRGARGRGGFGAQPVFPADRSRRRRVARGSDGCGAASRGPSGARAALGPSPSAGAGVLRSPGRRAGCARLCERDPAEFPPVQRRHAHSNPDRRPVLRLDGYRSLAVRRQRRAYCLACRDWTERRHHLAGGLGAALLQRCFSLGWARRQKGSRVLHFSALGERALRARFRAQQD